VGVSVSSHRRSLKHWGIIIFVGKENLRIIPENSMEKEKLLFITKNQEVKQAFTCVW